MQLGELCNLCYGFDIFDQVAILPPTVFRDRAMPPSSLLIYPIIYYTLYRRGRAYAAQQKPFSSTPELLHTFITPYNLTSNCNVVVH